MPFCYSPHMDASPTLYVAFNKVTGLFFRNDGSAFDSCDDVTCATPLTVEHLIIIKKIYSNVGFKPAS